MNLRIIVFLVMSQFSNCFGQDYSKILEYIFVDHSYEKITLKKDSFNYIYRIGLINTNVDGKLEYRNDTLVFNSEYQADSYKIEEKYNPDLKNGEFEILVVTPFLYNSVNLFATRRFLRREKKLLQFQESTFDSVAFKSTYKYVLNNMKYPRKNGAILHVWRKFFNVELKFKSKKSNSLSIDFIDYPKQLDYVFFKNVEAIQTGKGLIFLGKDNNLIEANFTIKNRVKRNTPNNVLKIYEPMKDE